MRTIKLIGTINTLQPVNITLPNTKGMPRSQGKLMIPASSIRGWLRHACHDGIVELFAQNKKFLNVDTHYLIASGVDTGRVLGVSGQATQIGANQTIRAKHPLLSTWGYWGLAGKLSVGSAVAQSDDAAMQLNGGARQHVFNRNEKLSGFVDAGELDYLKDILSADKYSAEAQVDYKAEISELKKQQRNTSDKDEKASIKTRIEEIEVLIREAKDSRIGAREAVQRPLEMIEAIDAGQMLPHRMILKDPTNEEFELTIWSIAMASLRSQIGGHSNANFGEVSAEWNITVTDINSLQPKTLGKVGFNDEDGFYCTVEGFDYEKVTKKIVDGTINVGSFTE